MFFLIVLFFFFNIFFFFKKNYFYKRKNFFKTIEEYVNKNNTLLNIAISNQKNFYKSTLGIKDDFIFSKILIANNAVKKSSFIFKILFSKNKWIVYKW